MNTVYDFADSSLDTGLLSQIGNIFASLANDYTGIFGAHESAQSQGVMCARRRRRTRSRRGS
jgi:hypothetical protein